MTTRPTGDAPLRDPQQRDRRERDHELGDRGPRDPELGDDVPEAHVLIGHVLIYHLVWESDFRSRVEAGLYRPDSLSREGFVHCSLEEAVLPVAQDYYPPDPLDEKRLLLLELDPEAITAEIRLEAPAPLVEGELAHLAAAELFPHVYGALETRAIQRVAVLSADAQGAYQWPTRFEPVESVLRGP